MLATTKTPKEHRSELLRFVHKPELLNVDYAMSAPASSPLLAALEAEFLNYDFETDPYIIELLDKTRQGNSVEMKLHKVLMSKKTYCYQELKKLQSRSKAMAEELGTSVSEWYVTLFVCILLGDRTSQPFSNSSCFTWVYSLTQTFM
jgi:hypothetical protein